MVKTGRNQLCPCGSGEKFKHCHGGIHADVANAIGLPPDFDEQRTRAMRRAAAERKQREQQQGLGRPIVSAGYAGRRIVVVGEKVLSSGRWNTFHDFLRDFLIGQLGVE